jgi:signal transduction histidine kinase
MTLARGFFVAASSLTMAAGAALMLHLIDSTKEKRSMQFVPIVEQTAVRLERALLTDDLAAQQAELTNLLAHDSEVAQWAKDLAEFRTCQVFKTIDEVAAWWSACLVPELAAALKVSDDELNDFTGVQSRLPALVTKLNQFERRLEQEKLEALKELAYGASHEINNPLANIAARAQTLLDGEANPERQRKLLAIQRQAIRAHEMISDLMIFARPPQLQLSPCDLREVVKQVAEDHCELATERHIRLVHEIGKQAVLVAADKTQLTIALSALIYNAIEAVGAAGQVDTTLRTLWIGREPWAQIIVRDNGPGITPEIRRRMFDPFFSGREAGRGMGFGLSKCWRIVTDHGGQVLVNPPAGRGAEVAIQLRVA